MRLSVLFLLLGLVAPYLAAFQAFLKTVAAEDQ